MDRLTAIDNIRSLHYNVRQLKRFKGKTQILREYEGTIHFLQAHETESGLNEKIFKEAKAKLAQA